MLFDSHYLQDDTRILTASGDQTLAMWDTGRAGCLGVFKGHHGSVKCVCTKPACPDVFASGHPQQLPTLCACNLCNAVMHFGQNVQWFSMCVVKTDCLISQSVLQMTLTHGAFSLCTPVHHMLCKGIWSVWFRTSVPS